MPKKTKRNGYYYFVQDMMETKKKSGMIITIADAFNEASKPWRDAPESVRVKYENIAKDKNKVQCKKYTSLGEDIAQVMQRQRNLVEADERERAEILDIATSDPGSLNYQQFFIMDVNYFCKTKTKYIVSEFTILRFSINSGLIDEYHEIVHPGAIPIGYAYEAKEAEKEFGLPIPDSHKEKSSYVTMLSNMYEYLKSNTKDPRYMPPIYTIASKVNAVVNFLTQLCDAAGEDMSDFRVYRVHLLFHYLVNNVGKKHEPVFPKETLAEEQLAHDMFEYTEGIACEPHEALGMPTRCTSSRCKRWVFSMQDFLVKLGQVNPEAGKHFPTTFNIEEAIKMKEFKVQQTREPSNLHDDGFQMVTRGKRDSVTSGSSRCGSALSFSSNASRTRAPEPIRPMQTDFSDTLSREAPEIRSPHVSLGNNPSSKDPLSAFDKLNLNK